MRKLIGFIVFLCLIFPCFSVNTFALNERIVYDRAGIFTASEIAEIEEAAGKFYKDSYASVYVVTDDSRYANSYDGDDFLGEYGISGDGIILVITDNQYRNYNIYPYGKCYSKISDNEYNEILDDTGVYNKIKSGDYVTGAINCIKLCEVACRPNVAGYVIGALITVLCITGIFVGCTVYSYKRKSRSEKYPLSRFARLDLSLRSDDFITKFVTVQVIKSSSSGGRGGSRGGGRGGR